MNIRLFKFNTPMLAVGFSVLAEALFVGIVKLFSNDAELGRLRNLWLWFHSPAITLADYCGMVAGGHFFGDMVGIIVFFSVALVEWWMIFFVVIWSVRHFSKRQHDSIRAA